MSHGFIRTKHIRDAQVTSAKLAAGAVDNAAIGPLAVDTAELAAGAVTDAKIATGTIGSDKLTNPQSYDPGAVASNVLYVANNVASTEQVTIGADVYEVEIVNTDSTDNTGGTAGDFNNTTDPLTVDLNSTDYPAIGIGGTDAMVVGRLIRIESEILRVTGISVNNVTFARGVSGTTPAAHADATDIFTDDGTALQGGTTIRTGLVTTLTPAAFTDALVDDINTAGTEAVVASGESDNEVLIQAADAAGGTPTAGVVATATSETLAGVNNAWANATLIGGRAAGVKRVALQTKVPSASEVTLGTIRFTFPFTPAAVFVQARVTSDGEAFALGSNISISSGVVTVTNDGTGDFAATHTLLVLAVE